MNQVISLNINGKKYDLDVDPETPLLYILRDTLQLNSPKYGCGLEQCGACKVLVDDADVPSCQLPVSRVENLEVTTLEGLGTADNLHPLQEAFLEEQVGQCGFCLSGMIITAQGLLNRVRYPTDDDIHEAYNATLCRCGVYDRVRRAIKLRVGRPESETIYEVQELSEQPETEHRQSAIPASLQRNPELDMWIQFHADETVTIVSGKVEIGQGIKTALMQIAADELDVAPARMRVKTADTGQSPDEGVTAGSMSVEMSGSAIRYASTEARYLLLQMAFEELESQAPVSELQVDDGTITDPATGKQVTYWQLMGDKRFGHQIQGLGKIKSPEEYQIVGQPEKRIDLLNKVTGGESYVQDMRLPDMLHARLVRPPTYSAELISVDVEAIKQLSGIVEVIKDGRFLAVVAETEAQAVHAMEVMKENAVWNTPETLPADMSIYDYMLSQKAESAPVINGTPTDDEIPPYQIPDNAAETLTSTYYRPYQMHGSLGPSSAVALWDAGKMKVWSHTQGVFNLQHAIAQVLNINPDNVQVIHAEGAGCYGHNGADDAGLDTALIAHAVGGKPISLKWTRSDEHGWEPYSSAMIMKMNASLDDNGKLLDWNQDIWSYTHSIRPNPNQEGSTLISAGHLENPLPLPPVTFRKFGEFGGHRNAEAIYNFPNKRVIRHFLAESPLRVSALRSLGAYANVFAIESFVDELAYAAQIDPLEFRLTYLRDEREKAVLLAAAEKANWGSRDEREGYGRGIAFARYKNRQTYAAVIVDVIVDRATGKIHLKKAVISADSGQVINPDGLSNQLEGGFVQAASATLFEEVKYNKEGITSLDWETYPIIKFADAPIIETVILNRPYQPSMGAGEATQPIAPAAIANAVFDAVGIRLREIPFTPERVRAALIQG